MGEQDPQQKPLQSFVHYKFLPGFGFYGFGLIHMIGGLSRAATSILRQLIDAGTLSNLPAGFKSRGTRIRNDDEPIQPGEFRDIDAPGGDIRSAIQPLPYKEPSGTLAQLLGVLVDSGRAYARLLTTKSVHEYGSVNHCCTVGVALSDECNPQTYALCQKQSSDFCQRLLQTRLRMSYAVDGRHGFATGF